MLKIAMLTALSLSMPTATIASSSSEIIMRATVPVVCQAKGDLSSIPADGTHTALGQFVEFCNTSASYDLILHHRKLENGEAAILFYDGKPVEVGREGYTLLDSRTGPIRQDHTLEAHGEHLNSPIKVSLIIQQH